MPCAFKSSITLRTSSFVDEAHVRCARLSRCRSSLIWEAIFAVFLLVPPPAPYVTLINAGFNPAMASTAAITLSNPSSVFGGNTSNEMCMLSSLSLSIIFIR